jgi:hypothetical protein
MGAASSGVMEQAVQEGRTFGSESALIAATGSVVKGQRSLRITDDRQQPFWF